MADIDYNEVFGLEEGSTGENTQEAADPAGSQEPVEQEPAAESTHSEEPPEGEPAPQSPEENARYAGIRRRAQQEARQRAEKEVDEKLQRAGMTDPQTGKPITSRAQLEAAGEARERREFMSRHSMDEAQYRKLVDGLPEVRAARFAQERAIEARIESQLNDGLRQIREIDGGISSLRELRKSPNYDRLVELVKRGNSLPDAYKLANFDTLTKSAVEKEKQATFNRMRGKAHMTPISRRQGSGMVAVPQPVLEQYRMFNPNASDEEIQNHYNAELKRAAQ